MEIKLHQIKVSEVVDGYTDSAEESVIGYGGKLNIRPKYQREFVYNGHQRDAVIDTKNDDGSIVDDGKLEIRFVKRLTSDLLKDAKISDPPVNLNSLLKTLKMPIKVKGDDLGNADGASIGKNIILFNNKKPTVRQRFTVAHELGHILLGHNTNGIPKVINPQSRDPNEVMANKFASELLVPDKFLKKENLALLSLSDLARKYWVSNEAMTYRIMGAKYINKISSWE